MGKTGKILILTGKTLLIALKNTDLELKTSDKVLKKSILARITSKNAGKTLLS